MGRSVRRRRRRRSHDRPTRPPRRCHRPQRRQLTHQRPRPRPRPHRRDRPALTRTNPKLVNFRLPPADQISDAEQHHSPSEPRSMSFPTQHAERAHHAQHPSEPLLRPRLQRHRHPHRRRRPLPGPGLATLTDDRRRSDALSSLSVIGNASRLRRYHPPAIRPDEAETQPDTSPTATAVATPISEPDDRPAPAAASRWGLQWCDVFDVMQGGRCHLVAPRSGFCLRRRLLIVQARREPSS
jgi:hypothetical protein